MFANGIWLQLQYISLVAIAIDVSMSGNWFLREARLSFVWMKITYFYFAKKFLFSQISHFSCLDEFQSSFINTCCNFRLILSFFTTKTIVSRIILYFVTFCLTIFSQFLQMEYDDNWNTSCNLIAVEFGGTGRMDEKWKHFSCSDGFQVLFIFHNTITCYMHVNNSHRFASQWKFIY